MEEIKIICTCDEPGGDPCPAHHRENQLQDLCIKLRNENRELRNNLEAYKHDLEMVERELEAARQVENR